MLALTMTLAMWGGEPSANVGAPSKANSEGFNWRKAFSWVFPKKTAKGSVLPSSAASRSEPKADVVKPDRPSDAVLQLRCQTEVFSDRELRASPMRVEVKDGTAHLLGRVGSLRLREHAERLAKGTPGLVAVENRLTLDPTIASSTETHGWESPAPKKRGRLTTISPATTHPATRIGDNGVSHVESDERPVFAPRKGDVVASRPRVLPRGEDDAVVTTYAVRRSPERTETGSPIAAASAVFDERSDRPSPTVHAEPAKSGIRRSGLVPFPVPLLPLAPPPPPVQTERPNVPASPVARFLQSDPRAMGLLFREDAEEVVLYGAARSRAELFALVDELEALPGGKRVWLDRTNLRVANSKEAAP